MLLAIDIGNTQTACGLFAKNELCGSWRVATRAEQTADELAVQIEGLLSLAGRRSSEVSGACLASVVPAATSAAVRMCERYMGVLPLVVGESDIETSLTVEYDPPTAVGADRIANAVGGYLIEKTALIIVDFGTATTLDVISAKGVYLGGVIAPGILTGAQALFQSAARLSGVALDAPNLLVGKNTEDSLKSGLVFGAASMVDGLVKGIKAEQKIEFTVIATGGLVDIVAPYSKTIDKVEPLLTLHGLKHIWTLNSRRSRVDRHDDLKS